MAKMNLARLKGLLGAQPSAPQAQPDPMEPDADEQEQAPVQAQPQPAPKGKKVKRKLFSPPQGQAGGY